ncbi:MAG: ABC transporter ATP-binding protein [Candidatus Bathyarchaeia archaeon]
MPMLEVRDLNVYHGSLKALDGVSFYVDKAEIVALIGSNGAGKSTTLKAISGLLSPASGSIKFQGNSITNLSPHKIVKVGISQVPEGRCLFPFLTVQENLEVGAYTQEARRKIRETIEWVFQLFPVLKERKKQLAYTLSGGEQQMLAIGRALMSRPQLIMLDEPSIGLAPMMVRRIYDAIKELNNQGITILLVEQNVPLALNTANRGYVLENGRITLEGNGEELLKNEHVRKAYIGV